MYFCLINIWVSCKGLISKTPMSNKRDSSAVTAAKFNVLSMKVNLMKSWNKYVVESCDNSLAQPTSQNLHYFSGMAEKSVLSNVKCQFARCLMEPGQKKISNFHEINKVLALEKNQCKSMTVQWPKLIHEI